MKKIFSIKSLIFYIPILSQIYFSNSSAIGETLVGDKELIERESIGRHEIQKVILKNRNIDLKNLSQIDIIVGSSLVQCYFGYQNKSRLVFCF